MPLTIAKIAGAIPRRDIHAATEGDGERGIVLAHAGAVAVGLPKPFGLPVRAGSRRRCGDEHSRRSLGRAPGRAGVVPNSDQAISDSRSVSRRRTRRKCPRQSPPWLMCIKVQHRPIVV